MWGVSRAPRCQERIDGARGVQVFKREEEGYSGVLAGNFDMEFANLVQNSEGNIQETIHIR